LGGEPEDDGTILGKAHRFFAHLTIVEDDDDNTTLVKDVERGEDEIKARYERALKRSEISPDTRAMIEMAYRSINAGHDQASALKRAAE
jgi:uncharacterized protein (TIGR02284 family)